ncbi:MAG: hypothetical protein IPM26_06210 [Saprospiraceae bacterium]|nr:hypothetical protein [Saprospiraceae bacterium]
MMHLGWIYLLIASIMEMAWMISLKYLDFKAIKHIHWSIFFQNKTGIITLVPLIAYIIFGLGNVVFFSAATKTIALSTAFAVWLGVALVGTVLIDILYFKESYSLLQLLFMSMIIMGVVGLKALG